MESFRPGPASVNFMRRNRRISKSLVFAWYSAKSAKIESARFPLISFNYGVDNPNGGPMKSKLAVMLVLCLAGGCLSPITDRLDTVNQQLAHTNQLLEAVNAKLESVDQRLGSTNAKLEGVENRLTVTNAKLEGVDQKLAGTNTRLDSVDQKLTATNAQLKQLEKDLKETNDHVKKLDEKIPRLPRIP
jgi:uncharacterized protein involved in exopolysaccharide biosynthesis